VLHFRRFFSHTLFQSITSHRHVSFNNKENMNARKPKCRAGASPLLAQTKKLRMLKEMKIVYDCMRDMSDATQRKKEK